MNIIDRETFAAMEAVRKAGARPAVKKYSTLKIIRALGDEWPVYREQLESGGYADQFSPRTIWRETTPFLFRSLRRFRIR